MTTAPAPATPPKHIDPAAIERELAALWRAEAEARKAVGKRDGKPLARTLLLNLIVFAPDQAAADRAREVVVALTASQPARVILVVADERAQAAGIDAWISLHCTTPLSGAAEVCGELVTLDVRGTSILDLPGTVLPLLLTDVPVFLWWQSGNPLTHPILDPMVRGVDRLIVDSLTWASPIVEFAEMAHIFANEHFPAVLSDLSWARLATWRYLTAQIFDPHSVRPYLNEIERIRIAHDDGSQVMAWLFGGWLASRLEWKLVSRAETQMQFAGGQVCEFVSTSLDGGSPSRMAGLHLSARDGATFEVTRLPDACTLTRVRIGPVETERVAPLPHETLADWLGHELNRLTHAATYEAAVRLIAGSAA